MKDIIITPEKLEGWKACSDGKAWGVSIIGTGMNLVDLLPKFKRSDWLIWTLRKSESLTNVQHVELAIICAKTVLSIYEKKYPTDDRPRKAIEAAIKYTKAPSEKNRQIAVYASYAAANAAHVANVANAPAYAANAAANAAYADADAAASYAAAAAHVANARKKHHVKMCGLIRKTIKKWGK